MRPPRPVRPNGFSNGNRIRRRAWSGAPLPTASSASSVSSLLYAAPLVLLLVALEESNVRRVAFVVDAVPPYRSAWRRSCAFPDRSGLQRRPAISAATASGSRRERIAATILITFVPCSARSAILLAIGGKYLGGLGVFSIFLLTLLAIAALGKLLAWRYADSAYGMVQSIPSYALPGWRQILRKTWERTEDIVTIVTPLLVGQAALYWPCSTISGAAAIIDTLLIPITSWWLGLPQELGVSILLPVSCARNSRC